MNENDHPFGYDTLKLRAVFIPEGNPNNVSPADITRHLGHDVLRIRAILIPDGNPDNITPADITSYLGYDVVRVRYAWRDGGGFDLAEPASDGSDGGEQAAGTMQGSSGPGSAPSGPPASRAMPPTPTPAHAPQYVDPASTVVAAWRTITAISPSSQPVVWRDANLQGETVAEPDAGAGQAVGSSELAPYIRESDPAPARASSGALARQAGKLAVLLSPIGTAQAQDADPEEEDRGLAEELADPLAEIRAASYYSIQRQIRQLDPRYATLTAPNFMPNQAALDAALADLSATRARVAANIASGHAFAGHAAELDVTTKEALQSVVEDVLSNPTAQVKTLARGRTAFYNPSTNTIVIVDTNAVDSGTVFRPTGGANYFKRLQ